MAAAGLRVAAAPVQIEELASCPEWESGRVEVVG